MRSINNVMNITMKDVAVKARVSTATVSRALMCPDKVSLGTRLRVEQAAVELGYLPMSLNRNLKPNLAPTVLVIVPDIGDPFFNEVLRGIEMTAARRGCLVILGNCTHQGKQEKRFIDLIINKEITGILLLGGELPLHASREQRRHLPPIVMVNESAPELGLPAVHIDNLTTAFNAVNYLHELGHQRVACIAGTEDMPLAQYRLQGYIQAITRSGKTVNPQYIIRGEVSYETGTKALEKLLALPRPPTAVFCHNDVLALGALFYAKQQGLSIPEDLSIMGFDNIPITQFSDPPLTTMAQPCFDIGREAMLVLIDQMSGKPVRNGSRLLDCELIVRSSTRSPVT